MASKKKVIAYSVGGVTVGFLLVAGGSMGLFAVLMRTLEKVEEENEKAQAGVNP